MLESSRQFLTGRLGVAAMVRTSNPTGRKGTPRFLKRRGGGLQCPKFSMIFPTVAQEHKNQIPEPMATPHQAETESEKQQQQKKGWFFFSRATIYPKYANYMD